MAKPASGPAHQALPWVIVGAGRVGTMMGLLGQAHGASILATWNRSAAAAKAAQSRWPQAIATFGALDRALLEVLSRQPVLLWVTVVDDVIEAAVEVLAGQLKPGSIALHTAGSLSSALLRGLGPEVAIGSLHPLQAIAQPEVALDQVSATFWTVEGDELAVTCANTLMACVEVTPTRLRPETKPLYHASAVVSANLLVALMDIAYELAQQAGVTDEQQVRQMLLPLAQSCLDNLATMTPERALTGPIARGDEGTVTRHEAAIARATPALLPIYELLTERARELVRRRDAPSSSNPHS